jgi:hypothetical protein
MQKFATNFSRLFLVRSASFSPKQRFLWKTDLFFLMKFSRNSEARPHFLIVIFGELPKGEILEKTPKNGRNLTKSHPKNLRNLCIN